MAEIEDINGNGGQVKEFQAVAVGRFFRNGDNTYCKIDDSRGFRLSHGDIGPLGVTVECIEYAANTVEPQNTYQGASAVLAGNAYKSNGREYIMGSGDAHNVLDITDINNPFLVWDNPDNGDVRPALTTKLQFDQ